MKTNLTNKIIKFLKTTYCLKENEICVKDDVINININNINDFNRDYIYVEFETFYTVKYFTTDLIKMYENHLKRFTRYFVNMIASNPEEQQACLEELKVIKFRSQNSKWMQKKVNAEMLLLDGHNNNYAYSMYNVGLKENPEAKSIQDIVYAAFDSRQLTAIKILIDKMPFDVRSDFYKRTVAHPITKAIWEMIEANKKAHNLSFVFEVESLFSNVIKSDFMVKKGTRIFPIDLETGKRGIGYIDLTEDVEFNKCSIFKFSLSQ